MKSSISASRVPLLPLAAYDHIDLTAAAFGADQPLSPIGHRHCRAVSLGHVGRVGLDLMPAQGPPPERFLSFKQLSSCRERPA
jgi:hypothetical protein